MPVVSERWNASWPVFCPSVDSWHCTVYCVLCADYCVLCTVYCVLCTVYYTERSVGCTVFLLCNRTAKRAESFVISVASWPGAAVPGNPRPFPRSLHGMDDSVQNTEYTALCFLLSVHLTVYTEHSTHHTAHCTLHKAHCSLYSMVWGLRPAVYCAKRRYSVLISAGRMLSPYFSSQCTEYRIKCTEYRVQNIIWLTKFFFTKQHF